MRFIKDNIDKIFFLLFSSFTGFIEIGSVIYSIQIGLSINKILLIALAYQIGCFFPSNIQTSKNITLGFAILSILIFSYISYINFNYELYWFATFLISVNLQILRSFHKTSINIVSKRVFRIIGFGLSPLYCLPVVCFFCILLIISFIIKNINFKNRIVIYKLHVQEIIMVLHQMHYFSYSYIIIIIIMIVGQLNAFYVSILFVLSWIAYTFVSYIFKKEKYLTYFISGHIFLMINLFIMSQIDYISIKLFLWILTGFGGGTVFCIEKILKIKNDLRKNPLEFSENIGHILGIIFCICIYSITKNFNSVILTSSILAFITAILMFKYYYSNKTKFRSS